MLVARGVPPRWASAAVLQQAAVKTAIVNIVRGLVVDIVFSFQARDFSAVTYTGDSYTP